MDDDDDNKFVIINGFGLVGQRINVILVNFHYCLFNTTTFKCRVLIDLVLRAFLKICVVF